MASNQDKFDETHSHVTRYLDVKLSDLADKVLDAPSRDAKTGKTTTLRRKIEWMAHEQHKVDAVLSNQKKILDNQGRLEQKIDNLTLILATADETEKPSAD